MSLVISAIRKPISRLLKNAHLRRCPHPSSLQRTTKYASLLRISGALHLGIFERPAKNDFFSNLLGGHVSCRPWLKTPMPSQALPKSFRSTDNPSGHLRKLGACETEVFPGK